MATRYNSRRPVRKTGPKRNMFWARRTELITMEEGNLSTTHSLLANFNTVYGANLFGFTVTRIRGHYTWWTPDSQDVSTSFNLSFGIRTDETADFEVANEDGEQTARTPFEDPYADWMYVRNSLGITDSVQTHSSTREAAENIVELDIKSQRKLSELGERLYLMAGTNTAAAGTVYCRYDLHVLLKQP